MFNNILLDPEQKETLSLIVEAARNVPREKRQKFLFLHTMGGSLLMHPGFSGGERKGVYQGDLEQLATVGLLLLAQTDVGYQFDVTPSGFKYYEWLKQRAEQPVQNIVVEVREYLDGNSFNDKYRVAYQKWTEAETLLWKTDSTQQLTTIGHLCRESMQVFISSLVERYQPTGVDSDLAHTVARLRSVITQQGGRLGDTVKPCLEALIVYWGTVSDLVQRQEHGAQKEGQALVWEDARRVVFQTAVVMFEIDKALS